MRSSVLNKNFTIIDLSDVKKIDAIKGGIRITTKSKKTFQINGLDDLFNNYEIKAEVEKMIF